MGRDIREVERGYMAYCMNKPLMEIEIEAWKLGWRMAEREFGI